ncbi:MAG: replicative DNA helicase [Phycisphaerae bacterium]|nr:replicative DNA helicase [Phycisphaerae bacterium]
MEGPSRPTNTSPDRLQRVPPQSIEAEQSLLGSIVLDSEVVADVLRVMGPEGKERFYRNDHRLLYETLVEMYDSRQPIDAVSLRVELARRGLLEEIGGIQYIVDLVQSVPSAANFEHYAHIVRDKALLRDLIRAAGELMETAYAGAESAKQILDQAEQKIFDVAGQRITGHADSLKDLLKQIYDQLADRSDDYVSGLPTGYYELDEITSGLQPGEMIVVAARPSMGKTALGLNIAENIAADEGKVALFFSMEQSAQQVAQRILCGRSAIDSHRLRKGRISEDDVQHLGMICGELEHAPLLIDDTPGMSPLELRSKARRLHFKHHLSAIFVDYLQLMHVAKRIDSRQQEVSEISRALKALARELNVPVVVIAQLNRQAEGREGHRPRMSDLRESGAIEQDADVILLLHREDYYRQSQPDFVPDNTAEVIIAKQRNGPTGLIKLLWDSRLTRFRNLSAQSEPYPSPAADYAPADTSGAPF